MQQVAVVGLHPCPFPSPDPWPAGLQGLQPEVRTYNTAIIACNMCGQPHEALKVSCLQTCLKGGTSAPALMDAHWTIRSAGLNVWQTQKLSYHHMLLRAGPLSCRRCSLAPEQCAL